MVLVDTSVWIHALRPRGNAKIQAQLRPLVVGGETAVTEWILLELMTGLSRSELGKDLLERFSPVPCISFQQDWWVKAWDLATGLRKRGVSPSAADCLIATVAMESSMALIHCDEDFEAIRRHSKLETVNWAVYL
jgi:predicted nucleic acid-binding protein